MRRLGPLAAAPLACAARDASACAVCFGQATDARGLYDGLWWGVVFLLAVTMSLVGGIGWAVWSIERGRSRRGRA